MTIAYNANYIETMPFSDTCIQVACQVGQDRIYRIPGSETDYYQAYFSYTNDSNVFVGLNAEVTIPPGGTVGEEPYSEFKPAKRYVRGNDVLRFVTPDTIAYIGVSFRKLQG